MSRLRDIGRWFSLSDGMTEQAQQARIYRNVAVVTMIVVTVLFSLLALVQRPLMPRAMIAIGLIDIVGLVGLYLSRRGRTRLASVLFLAVLMLLVSGMAVSAGGIRSPGMALLLVFTLLAALLLGRRAALVTAGICAAIATSLAVAEMQGILPAQTVRYQPFGLLLLNLTYIAVMLIVVEMIVRSIRQSLARAQRELAERQRVDAERERLVVELGERVKEVRLLHTAASLLRPERTFSLQLIEELVRAIPRAWMHADVCEARIRYGDLHAVTDGWRETPWMQKAEFRSSEGLGTIEVAYTGERPPQVEGPFLAEERSLIESLAEMLQAHIERDIGERNRQVMEASLRQAQKMDALGTLAGGIAHDFNNILAAIGGNAELGLAEVSDPQTKEYFNEIRAGYRRARDLVKRILIFSRRQESPQTVVRLDAIAKEAAQLLKSSIPPRIEIRTAFAPETPNVMADASQIHQVVMNLGTNAAYAMRNAPGVMSIDVDAVQVAGADAARLDLPPARYVRLTVHDTGTGMTSEVRERLFEPFFTTKGVEGTGLGLSVVHGIVRDHRGAIDVQSTMGMGTTFAVYLPAVFGNAVTDLEPEQVRGNGERILYVDDDVRIVTLMTRVLKRLGYEPVCFSDPVYALDAFKAEPNAFAAVITDMAMARMTGVELAAALHAIRPDIPIALASGYGPDDPELIKAHHIMATIQKPASITEISRVLAQLLSSAHSSLRSSG